MTESPQNHRIHSVFSTSHRKFVIDFRPAEIGVHATMYQAMGLDCHAVVRDPLRRSAAICNVIVIKGLT